MPETTEVQSSAVAAKLSAMEAEVEKERQAMHAVMAEKTRLDAIAVEVEKSRKMRVDMCGYLLESALSASKLPSPSQAIVRKQFSGKAFETAELQTAIDDARSLVSELTAGLVVQGPGRIHSMFDSNDKLQAAMDDILGAPRDPGKEKLQIHRPTGIRELYLSLTGDYDLHGGYYPDRAQFATTADFTGLVKNALNKIIVDRWQELGRAGYDWWTKIVQVEHFDSLNAITGILVGTVGALPTVAEGGEYTELAVGDSPETASFVKYGGYIPLTLELIDRDTVAQAESLPARAGQRRPAQHLRPGRSHLLRQRWRRPHHGGWRRTVQRHRRDHADGHANLLTMALSAAAVGCGRRGHLQPAHADQAGGHLLRHRPEDGHQPALPAGAAGPAAHRQDASCTRTWSTWPRSTARTSCRASRATWSPSRTGRTPTTGRPWSTRKWSRPSSWASASASCPRSSSPGTVSARPCS